MSQPVMTGREKAYVAEALDANELAVGRFLPRLEKEVAEFTGSPHAVACVNGTAALHLALRACGVSEGDEVIVPTLTFIAPINAVRYLNAHPVFMDADAFYNMDIGKLRRFLDARTEVRGEETFNKMTGRRIKAVLPVHVFGHAVDIKPLMNMCVSRGIAVVEDATESLGTIYKEGEVRGRYTGTIGHAGCLSFNGNKLMTAGGGGMVLVRDADMAGRIRYWMNQAKQDGLYYVHNEVGYNYRLSNLHAAVACAQLPSVPDFLERRRDIHAWYAEAFAAVPDVKLIEGPAYADNNHWLSGIYLNRQSWTSETSWVLMQHLKERSIEARPLWDLCHRQKPYETCEAFEIERATDLLQKTLSLPSSADLTLEEIQWVVKSVGEFLEANPS